MPEIWSGPDFNPSSANVAHYSPQVCASRPFNGEGAEPRLERVPILSATVTPLSAHPAFRTTSESELAAALKARFGARIAHLPPTDCPNTAEANRCQLPGSELWFCAYDMPLSIKFPDSDEVRIQFQHAGIGATWIGREMVGITGSQACISRGAVEIDFAADFRQVVWRAPRSTLVQKLAALKGGPVTSDLDFDPMLDLNRPDAATLRHILGCILHAADTIEGEPARIVLGELEQAFIAAFLVASTHSHRAALDAAPKGAALWQVQRAESYIEANWDQPITIEALVAATGVSTRTLFRTFKQSRNCSPLEFARRIRLDKARAMLEAPETESSVTEIAFACGFGDLSRFSRDFAEAFGETPSAFRKRKRIGIAG